MDTQNFYAGAAIVDITSPMGTILVLLASNHNHASGDIVGLLAKRIITLNFLM